MPTIVSKTIGTGGDYSTLQAWEDAAPANLVTADQVWRGLCKNQTFSSSSTLLNVAGSTTDATRYKELTTEAGASFVDNIGTGALRYNAANGAAIERTGSYNWGLQFSEAHFRISKLQIRSSGSSFPIYAPSDVPVDMDKLIVEGPEGGVISSYGPVTLRNSLVALRASSTKGSIASMSNGGSAVNVTFVATNVAATAGVSNGYGASSFKNCAFFNVGSVRSGGASPTFTNCATDVASPPSGCATTAYSTSTGAKFVNITDGSHDYRIQSGSSLIDAGTADSTNAATDILGASRPQGSAYDIGAFELSASGGGVTGASSGTLQLSGSAAGTVRVSGASAGTLAISGTSAAAVRVTGASTGALSLSGTATGTVGATGVTGQSSQTLSLTGTSTATVRVSGQSSQTLSLSGTAAGSVRVSGASAGTLSLTGTATGNTTGAVTGASAGVLSLSGSATGTVRVSGGSAAVLQITGNAGAQIVVRGVSTGVLSMTGSATGTTGGAEPEPTTALAKYTITARARKTVIQAKARRMEIKA